MNRLFLFWRACVFSLAVAVITAFFGTLVFFTLPFRPHRRYWLIMFPWCSCFIWLAKVLCGVRYQIRGMENLPDSPAILLSKHQSAWETVALPTLMPHPLCFVFKRELLLIPFFGWGIALMRMIHIDRNKGADAFADVIAQGQQKLAEGAWVIMFPEGTRTPVGGQGRYKKGGVRFAIQTHVPIIPIALNSGECWPRGAFVKTPGLITISIGAPIFPEGKTVDQLNEQVETWIENEMRSISPHRYHSERKQPGEPSQPSR